MDDGVVVGLGCVLGGIGMVGWMFGVGKGRGGVRWVVDVVSGGESGRKSGERGAGDGAIGVE